MWVLVAREASISFRHQRRAAFEEHLQKMQKLFPNNKQQQNIPLHVVGKKEM